MRRSHVLHRRYRLFASINICRSWRQSIITIGFPRNRLVQFGIAVELLQLCCISYILVCNVFFGTAHL